MTADIVLDSITVMVEIDGEFYDVPLEDKEYTFYGQQYDSPEEYLERVRECAWALEKRLGHKITVYCYGSNEEQ